MRTIKFRGKTTKGNWVCGFLSRYVGGEIYFITTDEKRNLIVDLDTVGQFTGLYDKDGKEIYEGDIVDAWSAGQHLPNGIIRWGEGPAGFFISDPTHSVIWSLSGDSEKKESFEVIGNIHDNPELLK